MESMKDWISRDCYRTQQNRNRKRKNRQGTKLAKAKKT